MSGKSKKEECLEACEEATKLDSEAGSLTPGSAEQVTVKKYQILVFEGADLILSFDRLKN